MTTNVTVQAHCPASIEVEVTVTDHGKVLDDIVLQDGETTEQYVYDGREIRVREVAKDQEKASD